MGARCAPGGFNRMQAGPDATDLAWSLIHDRFRVYRSNGPRTNMIRSLGNNPMKVVHSIMFRRLFSLGSHGAVSTEYTVLVGAVGLAAIFALVAVGPVLVEGFERSRNLIVSPFP